ncbi:MAG: MMPL family transporter [Mycobacteriaceae bacterium]|nr:MMPL family transporter [Mycobacteriaceae bacterium]
MHDWWDRVVGWAVRRPRTVVAAAAVFLLACAPLAGQLNDRVVPGGLLDPNSGAVTARAILADDFHVTGNTMVAVVESDGPVDAAADRAAANAKEVSGISGVTTYRNNPRLMSDDGRRALLEINCEGAAAISTVKDLRSALADDLPSGARVRVTGEAALNSDYNEQAAKDAAFAEAIAIPVLIVLLLAVFRSVVAMLIPIGIGVATLLAAQAVGTLLSRFTDVSNLFVSAVSIIGLAVSVDYSLFILRRYTQERDRGRSAEHALATACRTTGRSVAFGGVVVLVSLAALFLPGVMVMDSIAVGGISATVFALLQSMLLLPALLTLFGDKVYARNRYLARLPGFAPGRGSRGWREGMARRSPVAGLVAVAALAALAVPIVAARLQVPVAGPSSLPANAESRVAAGQLVEFGFPVEQPVEVVFRADRSVSPGSLIDTVNQVRDRLAGRDDVESAARVGGPDGSAAPASSAAVDWIRVVPKAGSSASAQHELVADIKREGERLAPGISMYAAGVAVDGYDFDQVLGAAAPVVVAAVLLLSLLLLYWVFRSWLMALCAVVLNNVVIGATVGIVILVYQQGLDKPVSTMTPVLIFAVMFGMSMDYMIVMATRMREEFRASGDHLDAITKGTVATTPVITVAAAVMATVFLSFLVAKIEIVGQLGFGLATAVVLDAAVLRVLVVPAVLRLAGPRVWGLPRARTSTLRWSVPLDMASKGR